MVEAPFFAVKPEKELSGKLIQWKGLMDMLHHHVVIPLPGIKSSWLVMERKRRRG